MGCEELHSLREARLSDVLLGRAYVGQAMRSVLVLGGTEVVWMEGGVSDSIIINPASGRTFRMESLLSKLMDWTGEKRIIAAAMREGWTPKALIRLAQALKTTADGRNSTGLSEWQLGSAVLAFVKARSMRRAIADYVSKSHQIPRVQVMRDLMALKVELEAESGQGREVLASGLVVPTC